MSTARVAFDAIAPGYDDVWTNSAVGGLQRDAVWRSIGPLFRAGQRVLDLGCGTGEDAIHFAQSGIQVVAIDESPEMVCIAQSRGVDATVLNITDLGSLTGPYDGAISNFGPLNCIDDLGTLRAQLARLIRPGGHLAFCLLGRFCAWETLYYLLRRQPRKALRRWSGRSENESMGLRVFYPSVKHVRSVFADDFKFAGVKGIGVCVPPSYVAPLRRSLLDRLDRVDRRIASWRICASAADHRLLVFVRK